MSTERGHNGAAPPVDQQRTSVEGWLGRDTKELLAAIERLSDDASSSLRDQVDRRPYATLGFGFLGAYVLGGGLTVRLGTFVLAAAWRAALANLVTRGATIRRNAAGR
jgi:hypothetical protein